MSCSYNDIAIHYFHSKALEYTPVAIVWERLEDHIYIVLQDSSDKLDIFFDHMNKVDPTKKLNLLWKLLVLINAIYFLIT